MRKLTFKGVAVITFIIGLALYFIWTSLIIPKLNKPKAVSTERVILLIPARKANETFKFCLLPEPSDRYMIVTPDKKQPLISEPLPEARPILDSIEDGCDVHVSIDSHRKVYIFDNPFGTLNEPSKIREEIEHIFQEPGYERFDMRGRIDAPVDERFDKTVLIRPSGSLTVGEVVDFIDEIKKTGANPIGIQIKNLDVLFPTPRGIE